MQRETVVERKGETYGGYLGWGGKKIPCDVVAGVGLGYFIRGHGSREESVMYCLLKITYG